MVSYINHFLNKLIVLLAERNIENVLLPGRKTDSFVPTQDYHRAASAIQAYNLFFKYLFFYFKHIIILLPYFAVKKPCIQYLR
jgi:hypothetical protein